MVQSSDRKMRIKQIYVYPIKSLRGTTPSSMTVTPLGFDYDRRFMLIRAEDSKNMHLSAFLEMALFTTSLTSSDSSDQKSLDTIVVSYGLPHTFNKTDQPVDPDDLTIPLFPPVEGLTEVQVDMHFSPTRGFDMGDSYNDWFSARFGFRVKLLYIGMKNRRKVLGNVPPNIAAMQRLGLIGPSIDITEKKSFKDDGMKKHGWNSDKQSVGSAILLWIYSILISLLRFLDANGGAAWQGIGGHLSQKVKEADAINEGVGFADCAPFLVINTKSWENAQSRLANGEKMDISKFRPNIIVDGAEAEWEEDYWGELAIGGNDGARIILTANCARCPTLNVDYTTGRIGEGEAGSILKKLQSDRRVDPGAKWSPIFGRYGFLARTAGAKEELRISVGDEVRVVRRNESRTKFEWPGLST